jgi:hypothetical protein
MMDVVLAANPVESALALGGQIAAIVICLYIVVFVIITLGFNFAMALGLDWLRQKVELLKMLRPAVDSVNKTTEAVEQGVPATTNENAIVRTVATVPARVQGVDKKVDQISERVINTMIEVRARTVQAKTIAKAFFLPGAMQRKPRGVLGEEGLEFESPGYQILMKEQASQEREREPVAASVGEGGYAQSVESSQLKDAPAH